MQWLVLVLYGFAAALFSYCFSLFTSSPLAAFAAVAGYQAVMFIVRAAARPNIRILLNLLLGLLGGLFGDSDVREELTDSRVPYHHQYEYDHKLGY